VDMYAQNDCKSSVFYLNFVSRDDARLADKH